MAVHKPNPQLLARQISSLRAQTVTQWSCIVGIDGLDGDAHALLVQLIDGDERFEVHEYAENVGVYRHFERLLLQVPRVAGWVSLADQDDFWNPEKFEMLLALLSAPGVAAVTGQARVVDSDGGVLGVTRRRPGGVAQTLLVNQVTGSFAMFRREVLDLASPFPPATEIAIHDHWLAACAAALGRIERCDRTLQDYVQHQGNVLGEARPTNLRTTAARVRLNGGLVRHLHQTSRQRWGWRVAMARALRQGGVDRTRLWDVKTISEGRLTWSLCRLVLSSAATRRLRPKAALGMLVTAWWWPRVERKG